MHCDDTCELPNLQLLNSKSKFVSCQVEDLTHKIVQWMKTGGYVSFQKSCFHQSLEITTETTIPLITINQVHTQVFFFFATFKSLNLQFSVFCLQPKALNPKPLKNYWHLVFSFYWSYSRILLAGLWADACWGGRWLLPQIWVDWIQECWYICAKQEESELGQIPFSFTLNGCMS